MIVDVHKYLIFGASSDLDDFFERAQRAGFVEFISPQKRKWEIPHEIQTLLSAIKILKKRPTRDPVDKELPLSPITIAERVVHANEALERLYEEERVTDLEISRIEPFGDFAKDDIAFLEKEGKRYVQFFCVKSSRADETVIPEDLIYVGTDYDLDYFVAFNRERKIYPGMIEIIIDRPLGQLKAHLELIKEQIAKFENDLKLYSSFFEILNNALTEALNEYHLAAAKKEVMHPVSKGIFAVEAWIPETKIKAFYGMVGNLSIHFEEVLTEKDEVKPTYMENKGFSKIGEDIVNVYDTPAATDKDPSTWVIWVFALFFSMIVADAGYGLIYLIISLLLKRKFPHATGLGKRFLKLMMVLSLFCIGWGVFTASFFGIEIGPENPYRKFSPLHYLAQKKAEYHIEQKDEVYQEWIKEFPTAATATDGHDFLVKAAKIEPNGKVKYEALNDFYDNILMELSLLVGIIHITISFLRNLKRNWAGAGWILFMIGGYLFFPSILKATTLVNILHIISKPLAYQIGEQMVYIGIGVAVVLALIQKRLGGLHEITNVVQVFADVLSYLRLYALALASMIMAATFNEIGASVGLVVGSIIILCGHSINIVIAVMGGVIHGLRLNFLEWYHYCFEGGGKPFNPLKLLKK